MAHGAVRDGAGVSIHLLLLLLSPEAQRRARCREAVAARVPRRRAGPLGRGVDGRPGDRAGDALG